MAWLVVSLHKCHPVGGTVERPCAYQCRQVRIRAEVHCTTGLADPIVITFGEVAASGDVNGIAVAWCEGTTRNRQLTVGRAIDIKVHGNCIVGGAAGKLQSVLQS